MWWLTKTSEENKHVKTNAAFFNCISVFKGGSRTFHDETTEEPGSTHASIFKVSVHWWKQWMWFDSPGHRTQCSKTHKNKVIPIKTSGNNWLFSITACSRSLQTASTVRGAGSLTEELVPSLRSWFPRWGAGSLAEELVPSLRSWFPRWGAGSLAEELVPSLRSWFPHWGAGGVQPVACSSSSNTSLWLLPPVHHCNITDSSSKSKTPKNYHCLYNIITIIMLLTILKD